MHRTRIRGTLVGLLVALAGASIFSPGAGAQAPPGGPILVVTDGSSPFGTYYAEMLRAEGLNEFAVADASALNASTLGSYQVVLLASTALNGAHVSALTGWVHGGGNLIAMRPGAQLAGLLGLGADGGDLSEGYLTVATAAPPGAGITGESMQFHGTADRWSLSGATPVATLYDNATAATPNPAVTMHSVGSAGGQAAAFTYDLARSVVLTRQGNPAWAGQERDGTSPVRSDDLFFGNGERDWVDLSKVHIPQADEQQRLLANLITQMNLDRAPLPRFWYLPRGGKAAVVMTGDDHGTGGTRGQFNEFQKESPRGCSVPDWQCVRATSYVYAGTSVDGATDLQATGFEIALHLNTGCANKPDSELRSLWSTQLGQFATTFPGIAAPRTNRTHCIAWSGWANDAAVERERGVRLDTNYYYWPGSWMLSFPGMFTGSGFPMRFAHTDGSVIDVYQAATQLTDEWGGSQVQAVGVAAHVNALLDRAIGPAGYYGVFTANMHTDASNVPHPGAAAIVAAAQARGVPVVSAVQMLDWLDGRNGSSFQGLSFSGGQLRFSVAGGARGLEAMLPASGAGGPLTALTRDGVPVGVSARHVKGIDYVVFDAAPGAYVATYPGDGTPIDATRTGAPRVPPVRPPESRPGADRPALRADVMKRTTRVSLAGYARLKVRCRRGDMDCLTNVRLRHRGRTIAKRTVVLAAGKTTTVKLRLTRRARRLLARSGTLRVKAVLRVTVGERSPTVSKTRIRLLAPGRR